MKNLQSQISIFKLRRFHLGLLLERQTCSTFYFYLFAHAFPYRGVFNRANYFSIKNLRVFHILSSLSGKFRPLIQELRHKILSEPLWRPLEKSSKGTLLTALLLRWGPRKQPLLMQHFHSNWTFSSANLAYCKVTPHYSFLKEHCRVNPKGWRHVIPQQEWINYRISLQQSMKHITSPNKYAAWENCIHFIIKAD